MFIAVVHHPSKSVWSAVCAGLVVKFSNYPINCSVNKCHVFDVTEINVTCFENATAHSEKQIDMSIRWWSVTRQI